MQCVLNGEFNTQSSILTRFIKCEYAIDTFSKYHTLHSPPNIACMSDMNPRGELRVHALDYREGSERCHHLRSAPCLGGWRWGGNHDFGIIFDICVKRVNNHFSLITWQHGEDRQSHKPSPCTRKLFWCLWWCTWYVTGLRLVKLFEISNFLGNFFSVLSTVASYKPDLKEIYNRSISRRCKNVNWFPQNKNWHLICFCIATKFVLRLKIWSHTKTLQPINNQIDSIKFFPVQKAHFFLFHQHF